jgi:hypothetical protein
MGGPASRGRAQAALGGEVLFIQEILRSIAVNAGRRIVALVLMKE